MKKITSAILTICMVLSLFTGCSGKTVDETDISVTEVTFDTEETETTAAETSAEEERGHYSFDPKACSPLIRETMGDDICDSWLNLVDAILAGDNTFACPDDETYFWMIGQMPGICLPSIDGMIWYGDDVDHPVKNGIATFTYVEDPELVRQKIDELGSIVEDILNENLHDDYDDFEKALVLYHYFQQNYVYDYETADSNDPFTADYLSAMRVFNEHTGICCEFATAYSLLLMQAGVDATTMSGNRSYDNMGHEWSYVRIGGKCYHIDPTYGLGSCECLFLRYFMMDDDQREAEDGYCRSDYYMTSGYTREFNIPLIPADDKKYECLWDKTFISLDHNSRTIQCSGYDDNFNYVVVDIPY